MYCTKCGEKLVATKTLVNQYDLETGEQLYRVRAKCPNKTFFISLHTEHRNWYYGETELFLRLHEANIWMRNYK
jgi:hypothetical protein